VSNFITPDFSSSLLKEVSQLLSLTADMLGGAGSSDGGDSSAASSFGNPFNATAGDMLGLKGGDTKQVDLASFVGNDWGDPHLDSTYSLGQTGSSGAAAPDASGSSKWDDMTAQNDLLSSTNQFGGFHYATNVSAPSSNGVTLNDEFTGQFGNGNMIDMGTGTGSAPTVTINGQVHQMQNGQSYQLNPFTTATYADGKLTISQKQGDANLTTTVTNNGGHLDIHTEGKNLDVGGSLVKPAEKAAGGGHQGGSNGNGLEQELMQLALEALELSETAMQMMSSQSGFGHGHKPVLTGFSDQQF
jgi:hypothetical protein